MPTQTDPKHETIEKRYYSIKEVSDALDVQPSVLRFWEKEFDMLEPKKNRGGHRMYTPEDLDLLKRIHYLVKVRMFTIKGAKENLKQEAEDVDRAVRLRETLLKVRRVLVNLRDALPESANAQTA